MRATGHIAVVGAIVLAIAGCRSGGSPWGFGKKSTMSEAEPQLPTANANPANTAPAYAGNASPEASQAFSQPPAAGAASPYPGQPAGYDTTGAGGAQANYAGGATMPQQQPYPEAYGQQQASTASAYTAGGYPTTGPAGAYQPPAAPPSAAPPAASGYPSHDPYADTAGSSMSPAGNSGYGAAPAAGYGTTATNYGSAPEGGYGAPADASYAGSPYPDTSATAATTTPGACNDEYCTDPNCGAASDPYAQAGTAGTAQPEQEAADRYGASADRYTAMAPEDPAVSAPGTPETADAGGYRPGSTGYTPGATGYSPPGVPKYEIASRPNVVDSPGKSDPYYRPGGTTDYIPKVRTPSASTDRYENSVDYSPGDPYANPGGGASLAPSPTRMH
ncbi:MAG: hypothetical protein DWQ37_07780 [Planctomycetota bacterium]|nr:MAG: hypothetical protein DWQ37_07780 [Planctomycetota bacterium]